MYKTPAGNRLHIGIFGKRNTGKSSLINAITGQSVAIVSAVAGTTTDPVYKSMEILPIGPCMLIDTAGIDDEGLLGEERVKRTQQVLRKTDIGIIVVTADAPIDHFEEELVALFKAKKLPYLFVINKCDLHCSISDGFQGGEGPALRTEAWDGAVQLRTLSHDIVNPMRGPKGALRQDPESLSSLRSYFLAHAHPFIEASAIAGKGIEELKRTVMELAPANWSPVPLVADLIDEKDAVVLVCPIDSAMPQGRLILPQVQVMRDILDRNAMAYVTKETELLQTIASLKAPPRLVITDSQVFEDVRDMLPASIPLTSFSTVFARHKGDINAYIEGVRAIDRLQDGDEILVAEACTHHVQPEDIGRSKIPTWLMHYTKKELHYDVVAGGDFPEDLTRFKLVIACGGCMVNRREIMHRIEKARAQGVPITNYGILMAYLSGILERIIAPFEKGCVAIGEGAYVR